MSDPEIDPSDFAFLYFAISVLIVALIPLTYSLIMQPLRSMKFNPKYKKAPDTAQKAIDIDIQRNLFYKKKSFYWKLFFWIVTLMILINTYQQLPDSRLMRGFDPYDVLGVKPSTPIDEIKKAYRQLAREFHPDKHQQETKKYSQIFDQLTKAYQCLTDPRKIPNCKKYGNPDGPQGFQIGVALPEFAVSKENQGYLLAGIFITLISIVLITFYTTFSGMGKYDGNGILMANRKYLAERIVAGKNKTFEECIETISNCEEIKTKDFIETIKCEFAPGILQMSLEICLQILKQLWAEGELKQIHEISDQIIGQITTLPKIIQYKSNLPHPGSPKMTANLRPASDTITEDDFRTDDLYIIKCNITGLMDQYIRSKTYPVLKQNQWNVVLFYGNSIIGCRQIIEHSDSEQVQFQIMPAQFEQRNITDFNFKVVAYADSYEIKLEQTLNVKCHLGKEYQKEKKSNKVKDE